MVLVLAYRHWLTGPIVGQGSDNDLFDREARYLGDDP
jgi:hypothetical protein